MRLPERQTNARNIVHLFVLSLLVGEALSRPVYVRVSIRRIHDRHGKTHAENSPSL